MRLALCSALWQRHELTPIWWAGVERIRRRFAEHGITMTVTVSGSELTHRRVAEGFGASWVRCINKPLGRKWNAAVESACRAGAGFILILGQDDFLSDPIIDAYAALLKDEWRYMGLQGIYFYEPATRRLAKYAQGGDYGSPIGAGRLIDAALLKPEGYRPWLDCLNRALDNDMRRRLDLPPAKLVPVTPECPAVDVKGKGNIWSFDKLRAAYPPMTMEEGELDLPEWPLLTRLPAARST